MLILKLQKNKVFNIITNHGLSPSNFQWKQIRSGYSGEQVLCIFYTDTDYFYQFDFARTSGHHVGIFCPGYRLPIETKEYTSWIQQLNSVNSWVVHLKQEIEAPDLWEQISKYAPSKAVALQDDRGNEPFSYQEVESIRASLEKLQDEIQKQFTLNKGQMDYVKENIAYLAEAAKGQGRIDWKNLFIGAMIGTAFNLALDPEKAKLLWNLVQKCFAGILAVGPP